MDTNIFSAFFTGVLYALVIGAVALVINALAEVIHNVGQRGYDNLDNDDWQSHITTKKVVERGIMGAGAILLAAALVYLVLAEGGDQSKGVTVAGFILTIVGSVYFIGIGKGYGVAKQREQSTKKKS